ncbi:MAG: hypothetical protein HQK55_02770 [Deltaproteobacteria bacterium]|nr:hypothetical protein [Deltaproteobacteria bacterium]
MITQATQLMAPEKIHKSQDFRASIKTSSKAVFVARGRIMLMFEIGFFCQRGFIVVLESFFVMKHRCHLNGAAIGRDEKSLTPANLMRFLPSVEMTDIVADGKKRRKGDLDYTILKNFREPL